jgi:serine/threonine protein phosphatase PrpC
MRFSIYQESRQGKRNNNEDRIAYCYSRDALLMVVADGMGGHYYGEVAAQIAVQYLTAAFQREAQPAMTDPFLFLHKGMTNAHHAILDFVGENKLKDSPRTTCVACVVQNSVAYWAHVGDSRLYHLRKQRILGQTRDHSRVRLLVDQGSITEQEAEKHPDRNKVYTCLGGIQLPEIEFSKKTPLESGDMLLLCTDGVWGPIDAPTLTSTLSEGNFMQAVPMLLNKSELAGGPHGDNLSVIAVRWDDNYVAPTEDAISTHTMALDEVQTQMLEFGRSRTGEPVKKLDLTEDEIEKAITEIRSAINKFSK